MPLTIVQEDITEMKVDAVAYLIGTKLLIDGELCDTLPNDSKYALTKPGIYFMPCSDDYPYAKHLICSWGPAHESEFLADI